MGMVTGETASRYGTQRWTEVGSGPPVLLLHGIYAGAGAHEWDALVPLLSARCSVRNAELVGFGASDRPAVQFTRDVVMEGVRALIDDAPADATVVASSLTGAYALSVIAVSDRGTMLDASSVFYMSKIVTGPEGAGVVDLSQPIGDNIRELAKAKGKPVGEIRVAVLDRPRHEGLIEEIRAAGAGTRLLLDGDVAGGINAARYESRIDMCVGIGGSPEGITTAAAIKAIGGFMQGKLAPKDDAERAGGIAAGLDMDKIYGADDLVKGDNTFFVATGVTDGGLVEGVRRKGPIIRTESIVLRSKSGTIRRVVADHLAEKWLGADEL